eukprot:CAMPEP_0119477794 /NCGR_PEP_ID=MMETSP1344-20130328/7808_1 /TAXON_ID=236787 /ORGANISM="Florenciella parvula, Strain CCMP2471" /LENGTH=260 /DNA_ID=CAMNT_0007511881 /DNA_START=1347 /DNA_END=2130 /DNA_ORIENTATION=-
MDEAPLYLFVLLDRNLERLANVVALPEGHILIEANVDLHQVAGPEVVSAHRVHRDDPFVVVGGDVGEGGDEGSVGRASCELLDLSLSGLHPARHDVHGDHPRAHRVHPPQRWHLRCQHHSDCRARVCDDIVHMVLRVGLNGPIVANRRKHPTAVDHEQKLGYDRHKNDRVGGHGYIELTLAFGKALMASNMICSELMNMIVANTITPIGSMRVRPSGNFIGSNGWCATRSVKKSTAPLKISRSESAADARRVTLPVEMAT